MAYSLQVVNEALRSDPKGFVAECDEKFRRQTVAAARSIAENRKNSAIVLLSGPSGSGKTTTSLKICEELEKLGITVSVVKLSWQDYTDRLAKGDFDLYLAETQLTADFDLEALVGSGGSLNYGKWADAETNGLLDTLRSAPGGARSAAATRLYERLADQAPIVPICFKNQTVLTQWGQVTGLTPTRGDPFAGDTWRVSQD